MTKIVSYEDLLNHFWVNNDPFDAKGQFCNKGHTYLRAIFVANKQEGKLAQTSRDKVIKHFCKQTEVTPILPISKFYPIRGRESYHQDFYKNNPVRYKVYRWNCDRDQRLEEIWGKK